MLIDWSSFIVGTISVPFLASVGIVSHYLWTEYISNWIYKLKRQRLERKISQISNEELESRLNKVNHVIKDWEYGDQKGLLRKLEIRNILFDEWKNRYMTSIRVEKLK